MAQGMILRRAGGQSFGVPEFSYTGNCQYIDDGNRNWRIVFWSSGTLVFTRRGNAFSGIELFMVGGGGGGSYETGGGGGYTTTGNVVVAKDTSYVITIGAGGVRFSSSTSPAPSGGTTSAFGISASGGLGGSYNKRGGNGGSGGAGAGNSLKGGVDGEKGEGSGYGTGQTTTTREFRDPMGTLYATGGSVAGHTGKGISATANTGDGGGGSGSVNSGPALAAGDGGSGIAIIRNRRTGA